MPATSKALLPSAADLSTLSDSTAMRVILAVDLQNARAFSYARSGMICGTVSFMACIASFTFLVMHGHATAAGVVLGTTVLGIVGKMIAARA